MKVALVSEHASPLACIGGVDAGGQNIHVDALARHLARLGASVVVYTRRDDARLPSRVQLCPGVVVEHVDAGPPLALAKDELLPFMGEFGEDLKRRWSFDRPDVVHAHFWMSALASLAAARPLELPVAVTFHALGSEKRRHQGRADTSPRERASFEIAIAESADLIISTSAAERDEFSTMGVSRYEQVVVPCGVDVTAFCPGTSSSRRTRPQLLALGRLVERKGVDDVIESLRHLPGAELQVVGGSDRAALEHDEDAQRLLARARTAGVADRVSLLGRIPHEELPQVIRSVTAVVCTPWYEPFGLVAVEAMACGVPFIASRVGGLASSVLNEVTGLHVEPRDPHAVARAAKRLIDDPAFANRLGRAGRRRAETAFSWETVAEATLKAYRTISARGAVKRIRL